MDANCVEMARARLGAEPFDVAQGGLRREQSVVNVAGEILCQFQVAGFSFQMNGAHSSKSKIANRKLTSRASRTTSSFREQLRHHGPFLLQFVDGGIDFCAAEFVDRHL